MFETWKEKASGLEQMKWPFEGFNGIFTGSIHECTRIKLDWGYLWEDKIRELLRNKDNRQATNTNSMTEYTILCFFVKEKIKYHPQSWQEEAIFEN